MAVIYPTVSSERLADGHKVYTWSNLTENDTEFPVNETQFGDRSWEIATSSSFGVGGQVRVEGTNLATGAVTADYIALTDSNSLSLAALVASTIRMVNEMSAAQRPRVVAGTGVNITVRCLLRK